MNNPPKTESPEDMIPPVPIKKVVPIIAPSIGTTGVPGG